MMDTIHSPITMIFVIPLRHSWEVCHDVEKEPKLLSFESESFQNKTKTTEDDARLDNKANGLMGDRFSRTFFEVKIFKPMLNSALKLYLTPTNIMRVSKYLNTNKEIWMWNTAACSTKFCVYRRSSKKLHKNRPETSKETKEKTERIILGHIKLYMNKSNFCTS